MYVTFGFIRSPASAIGTGPGRRRSAVIPLGGGSPLGCRWSDRRGAVLVEPSGRQGQGVRVEVWGRSRSMARTGVGCQLTISGWLVAGYGVGSVVGGERLTRSAGPPRGESPRPESLGDWRWAPLVAGGDGAGGRDGGAVGRFSTTTDRRPVLFSGARSAVMPINGPIFCVLKSGTQQTGHISAIGRYGDA